MAARLPVRARLAANVWTNFTALGAGKEGIILTKATDVQALASASAPGGSGNALTANIAAKYSIPAGATDANLWIRSTAGAIVTVMTSHEQVLVVDAT